MDKLKRRSWAAVCAHRASAGPMKDSRSKRVGTRRQRKDKAAKDGLE